MVRAVSSEQLLDLDGVVRRAESVRWDVLDATSSYQFTINPIGDGATITVTALSTIKRTLSGLRLTPEDEATVDLFAHRLRPSWVLESGDIYPLGVFLFTSDQMDRRSWGLEANLTLTDQSVILNQGREASYSLPVGALVTDAIAEIVGEVPVYNPQIQPASTLIATPIAWQAGTTRLQIVNDLCGLAGYLEAYFDNNGRLIARQNPSPLSGSNPDHVYNDDQTSRIVMGMITETTDVLDAPSRYVVRSTGVDQTEIVGSYDVPATAPHSFERRGYRIVRMIDEQGIESSAAATARAETLGTQDRSTYAWVTFSATPDPRHDIYDIVSYRGALYLETQWTLPLKVGGPMQHQIRRVYDEPN